MLRFDAEVFLVAGRVWEGLRHSLQGSEGTLSDTDSSQEMLRSMAAYCGDVGLCVSQGLMADLVDRLERPISCREYSNNVGYISKTLEVEMRQAMFMLIPADRAQFYNRSELFGEEVNAAFPSAQFDIIEAGNCCATARSTACVFHLMRVMEAGLKSLAKALGISYAPSWESYLTQIGNRVALKHKQKGIKWKRDESFFKAISGDLLTVKNAWRNPTMHIVNKYTQEEAENILRSVKMFMARLSERFSEV